MKNFNRLLLALWLPAMGASAQSYSIDWHKIASGSGTSGGGNYSLSGTIGQLDAGGPLTGGNFSVLGGFWALYALQTPGAPLLAITLTGTNTAIVSWPSASTGFNLQTTSGVGGNWAAPAQTINDNGAIKYIIVNPPVGDEFYRLKYP